MESGASVGFRIPQVPDASDDALDEDYSETDADINPEQLAKAVEHIEYCQSKIEELNVKAKGEIQKIEQKYADFKKRHFEERNKIIRNEIPQFWKTAVVNHPQIEDMITDEDLECLDSMVDLYVEEFEDIRAGYFIHFEFAPNPYFTNTVITKEFQFMDKDGTFLEEPISNSSKINWKPGMDLLKKKKTDKKIRKISGFFTWFTDNDDPAADDIAELIKEEIWLSPLQYFFELEEEASEVSETESESLAVVAEESEVESEIPSALVSSSGSYSSSAASFLGSEIPSAAVSSASISESESVSESGESTTLVTVIKKVPRLPKIAALPPFIPPAKPTAKPTGKEINAKI